VVSGERCGLVGGSTALSAGPEMRRGLKAGVGSSVKDQGVVQRRNKSRTEACLGAQDGDHTHPSWPWRVPGSTCCLAVITYRPLSLVVGSGLCDAQPYVSLKDL
jgi:hypothetical protein